MLPARVIQMCPKDILTLTISSLGVAVAAIAAFKGFIEYRLQGSAKRSDIFLNMRVRLRSDPSFANICSLLETDDPILAQIPTTERDRFLGFFEELAILANSGLLNDSITYYMFGYYAIRCLESKNFWTKLNRNHSLWSLFMDFAGRMKQMQESFAFRREDYDLNN
jgi:hypothetical protein